MGDSGELKQYCHQVAILNLGLGSCLVVGFQYVKFKNLADILNAIWNIPYEFKNQGKCYCKRGPLCKETCRAKYVIIQTIFGKLENIFNYLITL